MVVKLHCVQVAIHMLVGGATHEYLASRWKAHQGFCETDHIAPVLDLPGHMMHLYSQIQMDRFCESDHVILYFTCLVT